mgnify:CR=1 FL=1|tara:strand:- start:622 stop:927 length:306 start_codon:yes stop_codon:yes gene_type:complete
MTDTQEWAVVRTSAGRDTIIGRYTTFEKAARHCNYAITVFQSGLGDRAAYGVMDISPNAAADDEDPAHTADINRQVDALADSIDCPPALYKSESVKYLEAK